jgi:UDP-glucose 4-epimerase
MKNGVQIFNLGTGQPSSVKEMIKAFNEASGKELPYKIVGRRAGDLAEMWANADKANEVLGWKTELTIADAMRDTINYLNHEKEEYGK